MMVKRIEGVAVNKQREYINAENQAYDDLIKKGYTPQGADKGFKTVCVMKFEHPEFWENPAKRGKCEVYHFKNWQEAAETLIP
jgi:hypothetical protein